MTPITLSTAWLIGIAAARYLNPPLPPSAPSIALRTGALRAGLIRLLAILPVAGLLLWKDDPSVRRIAACGLFLPLGPLCHTLYPPNLTHPSHIAKAQELRPHTDRRWIAVWGGVSADPEVRDAHTNLCLVAARRCSSLGDAVRQNDHHWGYQ